MSANEMGAGHPQIIPCGPINDMQEDSDLACSWLPPEPPLRKSPRGPHYDDATLPHNRLRWEGHMSLPPPRHPKPTVFWNDGSYGRFYDDCSEERSTMTSPASRGLTSSGATRLATAWRCHGDSAASPRRRPLQSAGRTFGSDVFELSSQHRMRFQEAFTEVSKGRTWINTSEMVTLLRCVGRALPVSFVEELVETAAEGSDNAANSSRLRRRLSYDVARRIYEWALLPGTVSNAPPGALATGAAVTVHLAIGSAVDEFTEEACGGEPKVCLESRPPSDHFERCSSRRTEARVDATADSTVRSAVGRAVYDSSEELDGVEKGEALASRPDTVSEGVMDSRASGAVSQSIGSAVDCLAAFHVGDDTAEIVDSTTLTSRTADVSMLLAAPPRPRQEPKAPPVTSPAPPKDPSNHLTDLVRPPRVQEPRYKAFASGLVALNKKANRDAAMRQERWVKDDTKSPQTGAILLQSRVAVAAGVPGESFEPEEDDGYDKLTKSSPQAQSVGTKPSGSYRSISAHAATNHDTSVTNAHRSLMTVPVETPRYVPQVKRAGETPLKTWLQGGGGAPPTTLDEDSLKSSAIVISNILRPPTLESTRFKCLTRGLMAVEPRRDQDAQTARREWIRNPPFRRQPDVECLAPPSPKQKPQVIEKLSVAPKFPRPQLGSSRHKEFVNGLVATTHRSHARQKEQMLSSLRVLGATNQSIEAEGAL
eukprot:TRINITY_DN16144_c0_g2_i1.p1 TRINITY_DN16144_c0_g2~~TRINITY_DN16144_c0_g2_i1.p1  ORF type:complete len:709 (+),score=79.96 TRINITY_DN16144_c0_g2_i1:72-2198(+)